MNDETQPVESAELPTVPGTGPKSWSKWVRVAVMFAVMASLWLIAERTGLREGLTQDRIRETVQGAGVLGGAAYLGIFSVGELVHVPGVVFLLAARVAYGPLLGLLVAYLGALSAVTVSFFFVRLVGGKALSEIKWKPVRRLLARMEDRPVSTIIMLRTVMWLSPPLNYALAMSSVRFRDYFAGSAIGLAVPVTVVVLASECVLAFSSRILG